MKRTTISLSDDLADALAHEVRRRRRSASEITREALAAHLGLNRDEPRELRFASVGGSGGSTTGRAMEREIAHEWNDPPRGR